VIITLVFKKNANFFAENCRKSPKIVIITSAPGWANFRNLVDRLHRTIFRKIGTYMSSIKIWPTFLSETIRLWRHFSWARFWAIFSQKTSGHPEIRPGRKLLTCVCTYAWNKSSHWQWLSESADHWDSVHTKHFSKIVPNWKVEKTVVPVLRYNCKMYL
jgi:hypothetical protein